MTAISVERFLIETVNWANLRNDRFRYNWPVKGGWESWIQVDLTAYLLSIDNTLEVLREQPVYENNRQRVDLLINADQYPVAQIPVEIKAESFFNKMDPFINGARDDYIKLDENRNHEFSASSCIVLAFPFSQPGLDGVLSITNKNGQKIFSQLFLGEIAVCAAVYDTVYGWHPPRVPTMDGTFPDRTKLFPIVSYDFGSKTD